MVGYGCNSRFKVEGVVCPANPWRGLGFLAGHLLWSPSFAKVTWWEGVAGKTECFGTLNPEKNITTWFDDCK